MRARGSITVSHSSAKDRSLPGSRTSLTHLLLYQPPPHNFELYRSDPNTNKRPLDGPEKTCHNLCERGIFMFGKFARSIRNNVLFGLLLVTPIVVTGFIVNWLFKFTTNSFVALIPYSTLNKVPFLLRSLTLIVILVMLFLIGLLVRNIAGKKLFQFGDMILARIPVINKIYLSVRQISEALLDQSQTMFKEVVLVEYPRKGLYSMGFVTAHVPRSIVDIIPDSKKEEFRAVFIATTPNPTSGFCIFVRRSEMIPLPISVGDAMKMVVSGGAVFPGSAHIDNRPTFFDKLESWLASQGKTDTTQELPKDSGSTTA